MADMVSQSSPKNRKSLDNISNIQPSNSVQKQTGLKQNKSVATISQTQPDGLTDKQAQVAKIRAERQRAKEEKRQAHLLRKASEKRIRDAKIEKADEERRKILEHNQKKKTQKLKEKNDYINEKKLTETLNRIRLNDEAKQQQEEKIKYDEKDFHLQKMFQEKRKLQQQHAIREANEKALADYKDEQKIKKEVNEAELETVLFRLEETEKKQNLEMKKKESARLAIKEANEKARQDAEDVAKLEKEQIRRKRESMQFRVGESKRHSQIEENMKESARLAIKEANEKARQDAEDVTKLEKEKIRRKRESMQFRVDESLRHSQIEENILINQKEEFCELLDDRKAAFESKKTYSNEILLNEHVELNMKKNEFFEKAKYNLKQKEIKFQNDFDLFQERKYFYESIKKMKQATKESIIIEIEYQKSLTEKNEIYKLLQEHDRLELSHENSNINLNLIQDHHNNIKKNEKLKKNELILKENEMKRYHLHELMLKAENKFEEQELRKSKALDKISLTHKIALAAFQQHKELEQQLEQQKISAEYKEDQTLKKTAEFKEMIEYQQQDRIDIKEAKLSIAMAYRASVLDQSIENSIRNDLYLEEQKEYDKEKKAEDERWYLLNKEAQEIIDAQNHENNINDINLNHSIEQNGRDIEELNKLEEKLLKNQHREFAKIDKESVALIKELNKYRN